MAILGGDLVKIYEMKYNKDYIIHYLNQPLNMDM